MILLPGVPYQLDQLLTASHKQQKLFAFFTLKSGLSSNDATNGASVDVEEKNKLMDSDGCEIDRMGNLSKCESEGCAETDDLGFQGCCNVRDADENSTDMDDESSIMETRQESLQRPSSSSAQHSTLGDPNFVENYFKVNTMRVFLLFNNLGSNYHLGSLIFLHTVCMFFIVDLQFLK